MEVMIVDYLQRSMEKYCEVDRLRMAEYEKIRADVVRRMGTVFPYLFKFTDINICRIYVRITFHFMMYMIIFIAFP